MHHTFGISLKNVCQLSSLCILIYLFTLRLENRGKQLVWFCSKGTKSAFLNPYKNQSEKKSICHFTDLFAKLFLGPGPVTSAGCMATGPSKCSFLHIFTRSLFTGQTQLSSILSKRANKQMLNHSFDRFQTVDVSDEVASVNVSTQTWAAFIALS